jgi:hypothetical protein
MVKDEIWPHLLSALPGVIALGWRVWTYLMNPDGSARTGLRVVYSPLMRLCKACGVPKKPTLFYGGRTKSAVCNKCYMAKKASGQKIRRSTDAWKVKNNEYHRERRQKPELRATYILKDSRAVDRRKGRENDLSKEFIERLISEGCVYCGDHALKMTLDRRDNGLGHTQKNCIPCCFRCNLIRRDMPYQAWIQLAVVVRKLRENGDFGDWAVKKN